MCENPVQIPFPAHVFDFGDKFSETDGDRVLAAIATSGDTEKPAAEEVAAALAPVFGLASVSENVGRGTEWIMGFEAVDNECRFSVQLGTDSFELDRRNFNRSWMLGFVERSPENQALSTD